MSFDDDGNIAEPIWQVDHCEPIAPGWVHILRKHSSGALFSVPIPAIVVERAVQTYMQPAGSDEVSIAEHRVSSKWRVSLGYVDPETGEIRSLPEQCLVLHAADRVSLFKNSDWVGATTREEFEAHGQAWEPPKL